MINARVMPMQKRVECRAAEGRFRKAIEVSGAYLDEEGTREGVELMIFRRSRRAITGIGVEMTVTEARELIAGLSEVIAWVESGGMRDEEEADRQEPPSRG